MSPRAARTALWLALAMPGMVMAYRLATADALPMDLLEPSGETGVRLMILALLPGPLASAFGVNRLLKAWLAIRRDLGLAAFGYAALHLGLYLGDMPSLAAIAEELPIASIWTGWLAFALLAVPAAISSDRAMRALRRRWKTLQRLVYPALLLTLAHWLLLGWSWRPALFHAAPLLVAWSLRAARRPTFTALTGRMT